MKILSVVIPVYNTEKYLVRCIDSIIIPEILDRIEILIINDGSTDGSLAIAQKYQEQYPQAIKVVDKKNAGKGSCMNIGLDMATGKYFRELDSDDYFNKKIMIQYLDLLETVDTDIFITHYNIVNASENIITSYTFSKTTHNQILELDTFDFETCEETRAAVCMHSSTYRTKLLKDNNVRFQENVSFTDIELVFLGLLYAKTIYFASCNLYQYFVGREGASLEVTFDVAKNNRRKKHLSTVAKRLLSIYSSSEQNLSMARKKSLLIACSHVVENLYDKLLKFFDGKEDADTLKYLSEFDTVFCERLLMVCRMKVLGGLYIPHYWLWKKYGFIIGCYFPVASFLKLKYFLINNLSFTFLK